MGSIRLRRTYVKDGLVTLLRHRRSAAGRDAKTCRLEPIGNPFGPTLLPMSPECSVTYVSRIACPRHQGPLGYTVRASEAGKHGLGFEFASYSETSPYAALGRVRSKMARGLARRHLSSAKGPAEMLHDSIDGRISSRDGEVVVVVDGVPLDIDDLARFLAVREGWGFELRITDSLE